MRKTLLILALAAALPVWCAPNHSKGHSFEFTIGGGYSMLGYGVKQATENLTPTSSGSYGVGLHLGYNWFFTEYVGLGVGVDAQRYGQSTTLNGTLSWIGVTDTDGELYDHRLALHSWKESQQYWNVEIPLSLVFSIPVDEKIYITAQIGAKYCVPISGSYSGGGVLTHSGYYQPWNLILEDKPNHGFYTENDFHPNGRMPKSNYWSIFGKLGVAIPLVDNLDMLIQATVNGAITPCAKEGEAQIIGFRNDRAGQEQTHYFMTDYIALYNTEFTTGKIKPLSAGLEIGIRYTIQAHRHRRYPCRCVRDYY